MNTIPKTIHFCWFSGDPFPIEVKECMESWKRILPDYTLRHWTYNDAIALDIPFVTEALLARKWAFAADVVRLYAIYSEGGIYMDTDILLFKPFEQFMIHNFVSFHESYLTPENQEQHNMHINEDGARKSGTDVRCMSISIQAAFLMGMPNNEFCKLTIEHYRSLHFTTDFIAPHIYALVAEKIGYKYLDTKQILGNDIAIYPSENMAPRRRAITTNSFAVHRCEHGWVDFPLKKRIARKIRRFMRTIRFYISKRT